MMRVPPYIQDAVAQRVKGPVRRMAPVAGGCIAQACRVETDERAYFLKYGSGAVGWTFPAEADGLLALQTAGSPLRIPAVLAVDHGTSGRAGYLLMDWIEPGPQGPNFWEAFGEGLAAMHRCTSSFYGFDDDNFIGRTPQRNTWASDWPAFVRSHRLEPQVKLARDRGRWLTSWDPGLAALYDRLGEILPARPPSSLLHGDLWGGNFLVTSDGRAALVDPAVYYGHREADLAMTELFGGFSERFYAAYRATWPLEPGYAERREVYNLYHLLNHLNLFGGSYSGSVAAVLRMFV